MLLYISDMLCFLGTSMCIKKVIKGYQSILKVPFFKLKTNVKDIQSTIFWHYFGTNSALTRVQIVF